MAMSLLDLAARMATMDADIKTAMERGVVRASKYLSKASKGIVGHPQPEWPPLKPETIKRKAKGDTPLLETGEYRASISWQAPFWEGPDTCAGWIGSNDPKALWMEYGTSKIPPRPVFGLVATGRGELVAQIVGASVAAVMVNGGPNYHDLREFLHLLGDLGRELKDLVDDDNNDDGGGRKIGQHLRSAGLHMMTAWRHSR